MFALSIIGLIASLASTGYSIYAANEQADAAEDVAEYNAREIEDQRKAARETRAMQEIEERKQSRRNIAAMEATYAKSGVMMEGTPALIVSSQALADEFNILSRTRDQDVRGQRLGSQAMIERMRGNQAGRAYRTKAAGTLIAGIGSAAQQGAQSWDIYNK